MYVKKNLRTATKKDNCGSPIVCVRVCVCACGVPYRAEQQEWEQNVPEKQSVTQQTSSDSIIKAAAAACSASVRAVSDCGRQAGFYYTSFFFLFNYSI